MYTRLVQILLIGCTLLAGCGSAPPPPPAEASGPPGTIEATVLDSNSIPARKLEARLLAEPKAGQIVAGGDGGVGIITSESARPATEGANMVMVKTVETNDYGKFKIDSVPPGKYLLSAGAIQIGMWREWVTVEPGKTLTLSIKLSPRKY